MSYLKNNSESQSITKGSVLVGGCFDLLHIGHVRFLTNAKKKGSHLVVALESDEFIRTRKKREPYHTQDERAEILTSLDCVDTVILLPFMENDLDYVDFVNWARPKVIAVSQNDPKHAHKEKQAKQIGADVMVVQDIIEGKTTTNMLKMINSQG